MRVMKLEYAPVTKSIIGEHWEELRDETVRFCEENVREHLREIRDNSVIPDTLLCKLKATGWLGLLIPKSYGGFGGDCLARVINIEHLAQECPDLGAILQIAQLGTGDVQKKRIMDNFFDLPDPTHKIKICKEVA